MNKINKLETKRFFAGERAHIYPRHPIVLFSDEYEQE